MTLRLAISGFGRIGRLTMRALQEMKRDDMEIVLINTPGSADIAAHVVALRTGDDAAKGQAALALRDLAANNAANKVAIAEAGGIAPLVALARDGTEAQKEEAAAALAVLAVNDANKAAIAREGGIAPLRAGVAVARDELA